MPMGMFTMLSEGAGEISGGQKQRIMIARAFASNPSIILFDEATSALDNISQRKIIQSLEKFPATKIVIAHRLSTVVNCDKIVVLDKGKIAEEGTYRQLTEQKGLFYKMAERQIVKVEYEKENK
jgi:ATP-binding cassette subfamily C protein